MWLLLAIGGHGAGAQGVQFQLHTGIDPCNDRVLVFQQI